MTHYTQYVEKYQYDIVTQKGEFEFITTRDIDIVLSNGIQILIPKGYNTDLASVPRLLWSIIPPFGEYTFAAIIHDYLYDKGMFTKEFADKEFRMIMKYSNVIGHKRFIMYSSVKLFGKGNFNT